MAKQTVGRGLTCRMRPARRDEPSWRVCDGEVVVLGAKGDPTALARVPLLKVSARARALVGVSAGGHRTCRSPLRKYYAGWSITGALVERPETSVDLGGRRHCRLLSGDWGTVVWWLVVPVLASKRAIPRM